MRVAYKKFRIAQLKSICLIIHFLFSISSLHAQLSSEQYAPINLEDSYIERPSNKGKRHFTDTKVDFDTYLYSVIHSGKLIDNGQEIDYLNELMHALGNSVQKRAALIRSNVVGTFSSDSIVYVTTGLISQIENTDQLIFFLAREVLSSERSIFWKNNGTNKYISSSYDEKIATLIQRKLEEDKELDQLALERVKSFGVSENTVASCFKVLEYSHLPFSIKKVPVDYFNSPHFFLPQKYFEPKVNTFVNPNNSVDATERINMRIKHLALENVEPSKPYHNNSPNFNQLQKSARLCYLDEALLSGEFEIALYTVFLLEEGDMSVDSIALQRSKKMAWFGLALREMRVITPMPQSYYTKISSSEIIFLQVLRRLPSTAIITLAIRELHEGRETSQELNQLYRKLLFHVKSYPFADLREFSSSNYYEKFRSNDKDTSYTSTSKYEEMEIRQKSNNIDSSKFYLYGLADLVSDSSFWKEFNSLQLSKISPEASFTVIPAISCLSKRKRNNKKSDKKLKNLSAILEQEEFINSLLSIDQLDNTLRTSIKNIYSKEFSNTKYATSIPLATKLESNQVKTLSSNSDYLVLPMFQSTVKPQYKSKYLMGIFVLPLPYVITDFLLSINQSSYAMLIVDAKTSLVVHLEYMDFYEPLTAINMKERIVNSINQAKFIK